MEWVYRRNIERFERLIEVETDPAHLLTLKGLLVAERAKLADYIRKKS